MYAWPPELPFDHLKFNLGCPADFQKKKLKARGLMNLLNLKNIKIHNRKQICVIHHL